MEEDIPNMSVFPLDNGRPVGFTTFTEEAPADSISEALQNNDIQPLVQQLNVQCRLLPPRFPDFLTTLQALKTAASEPEYKECLELLLRSDTRKNTLDGATVLHITASKGYLDIVKSLLDYSGYSVNINEKDVHGCTALHWSVKNGHFEVSRLLLEKGASVQSFDYNANFPLHFACEKGRFDMIRLLLECDLTTINYRNLAGITPIMQVLLCMSARSSVNLSTDMPARIPVNVASEVIRYLLENGAEVNVCDKSSKTTLQYATETGNTEILSLVLQSTNIRYHIDHCLFNLSYALYKGYLFHSLSFSAIKSLNIECLSTLLTSKLPKSVLQTPSVLYNGVTGFRTVVSPLALILNNGYDLDDEQLDAYLHLLLKYEVIMLDEYRKILGKNWPSDEIIFSHPFLRIFRKAWPFSKQLHYFNLLNANNVTTDYCLLCYHDNTKPFDTFAAIETYQSYYEPVINAVQENNIEVVKLLISNSAILEPEALCDYLITYISSKVNLVFPNFHLYSTNEIQKARNMYQYLISLKPAILKTVLPIEIEHFHNQLPNFTFPTASEEFAKTTLQQLCRTVIRQQLREPTLENNLLNFQRKISELPLPELFKNYLLFKV